MRYESKINEWWKKMLLRENERVLKLKGRVLEEEEGKRFM